MNSSHTCDKCGIIFDRKTALTNHLKAKISCGEAQIQCLTCASCKKTFARLQTLQKHQPICKGEKEKTPERYKEHIGELKREIKKQRNRADLAEMQLRLAREEIDSLKASNEQKNDRAGNCPREISVTGDNTGIIAGDGSTITVNKNTTIHVHIDYHDVGELLTAREILAGNSIFEAAFRLMFFNEKFPQNHSIHVLSMKPMKIAYMDGKWKTVESPEQLRAFFRKLKATVWYMCEREIPRLETSCPKEDKYGDLPLMLTLLKRDHHIKPACEEEDCEQQALNRVLEKAFTGIPLTAEAYQETLNKILNTTAGAY